MILIAGFGRSINIDIDSSPAMVVRFQAELKVFKGRGRVLIAGEKIPAR